MSYKPMTPDEAAKLNTRPEGTYAFEVTDAKDKQTKEKGFPMIALTLGFFDADGSRFTVKDWLVHSDSRWSEKKCFDFANATGLTSQYSAGTMCAQDCLGRSGFAFLGIEAGKPKQDGSGNFPDRNAVKWYSREAPKDKPPATTQAPVNAAPASVSKGDDLDEDVPF